MTEKGKTIQSNPFDAQDPRSELIRAVRLCHPDWENAGRLTFRPPVGEWTAWRDTVFLPVLHPRLAAAFSAFSQGHRRELVRNDGALETALPAPLGEASRRAGRLLLSGYTVPNGEKLWASYRDRVAAGEAPGHFAVVLAVRAAAFNLPLPQAVSALLFLECRGGRPDALPADWMEMVASARPKDGVQLRAA
jgi:hypothetical protein